MRSHFWIVSFILLALGLAGVMPASAQPRGAGNVANPNMGGSELELIRAPGPRFVVKAVSFEARDQTGWDWTGWDDVVTIFRTEDYALVTDEYGHISSSDENPWPYGSGTHCIMPAYDDVEIFDYQWKCDNAGVSAPLAFTVGFYEQDSYGLFSFCANQVVPTGDLRPADVIVCEQKSPHDLIGTRVFRYSLAELLEHLPRPGMSWRGEKIIGRGCNAPQRSDCRGSNGQYVFRFAITRVADAR